MDAAARFAVAAATTTTPIVEFFTSKLISPPSVFADISKFREQLASRSAELMEKLRVDYLTGAKGPAPASRFLNKTRGVYEFVRVTLGIKMHGEVNMKMFEVEPGMQDISIGQNVSLIHEVCFPRTVFFTRHSQYPTGYPRWENADRCCSSIQLQLVGIVKTHDDKR